MSTFNSPKHAFARERLTISNAVKQLTASVYDPSGPLKRATGARIALLSGSGDIAFTEDGTDPTADITTSGGVGTPASAGDIVYLESFAAVSQFKAIRVDATDAIVEVVYYRG